MNERTFIRLKRASLLLGFLFVAIPLACLSGPQIEGQLSPIINDAARSEVSVYPDGKICWDTAMEKLRLGVPAYALYTTMVNDRPTSIFVTTGAGTPLTQRGFANHPPGDKWITRYCTVLPEQLRTRPRRIDGTLYYQIPCDEADKACEHHWWRWRPSWWLVPHPLPSLTLPAD